MRPNTRNRLAGLSATTALAAIVVGLPALLLAIGATPLPPQLPDLGHLKETLLAPDDGTLLLGVLTGVAWIAWAVMAVSLTVEGIAWARHAEPVRLPGLRHPQAAARVLLTTAALLFIATPTPHPANTTHPTITASADTVLAAARDSHDPGTPSAPINTATQRSRPGQEHATATYTVRPGDSLWRIAEHHLGDGARYGEIVELNRELVGAHPNFLQPGWQLTLPVTETTTAGHTYTVRTGDTLTEIAQAQLGDPARYPEIYAASRHTLQLGGRHLVDPDLIDVGWQLTIPATPAEPAPPAPRRPRDPAARDQPPARKPAQHPHDAPPAPPASPATTPAPPPSSAATPEISSTRDAADASEDTVLSAPWILTGLTGGGALLAGALLLGLRTRRRAAFRNRRPGRAIAAPAAALAPVEMTIHAAGASQVATLEHLHQALLHLAAANAATGQPMPPLAAAELGNNRITVHLTGPAELPGPWQAGPDHTHWHLPTDTHPVQPAPDLAGPDIGAVEAPYPLLVTIGSSDTGHTWMLNCEELGILRLDGDATFAHDLARHIAAQIAVNPWSRRVRLEVIGIAEETADMDDRITYHPNPHTARPVLQDTIADTVATLDRAARRNTDTATGRTGRVDDDTWPARMILLDATTGHPDELGQLLQLVTDHPRRCATSIVLTGTNPDTPGATLTVTAGGRLRLPAVGLDLIAVGLTSDEARGCALLYAHADAAEDTAVPTDPTRASGWEAFADLAGALRREHTLPRSAQPLADDEPLTSLLDHDNDHYLQRAAVVADDLDNLAPQVPKRLRATVEAADPTLDHDIADWFSPDCRRPRLTLLGPVTARTHGKALTKRRPYFTELLAYLALNRRRGVTVAEVARTFGITDDKARDYAQTLREWLGVNPATGEKHLPNADQSPIAHATGINAYQVDNGLLIDTDLLLRLRLRADARGGPDGHHDLHTALALVQGPPFSNLREAGWNWLFEGERHDEYAKVAIADIALTVATHALANNDLLKARSAAILATEAAPDEEATRLCLIRTTEAEGHHTQAARMLRDDVCNRSDDDNAPPELSERTKTIIRNHAWLAS